MTEKEQQSTIQPEQTRNLDGPAEDEISLIDLLEALVRKKILILAITSFCTLIAIFYVQSTTPIYRATIAFLEPQEIFLSFLPPEIAKNLPGATSRDKESNVLKTNPSAFLLFLAKIGSYKLKNGVFVDGGFQEKFFGDTRIDADQAALEIHNSIKVFMPKETPPQTAHFEIVGPEPEAMAEFLNAIAESAKEDIVKEIRDLLRLLTNAEITKFSLKIDNLRLAAKEKRAKEISHFSAALVIAKNLGIKNNNFSKQSNSKSYFGINTVTTPLSGEKMHRETSIDVRDNSIPIWFLYGEKALQQEIIRLKSNQNKAPVPGVAENEITLKQLQAIDLSLIKINVATISQPSIPPTESFEPEKIKIITLGMALGLFISIIMAFLINVIEQSRTKKTPSTST